MFETDVTTTGYVASNVSATIGVMSTVVGQSAESNATAFILTCAVICLVCITAVAYCTRYHFVHHVSHTRHDQELHGLGCCELAFGTGGEGCASLKASHTDEFNGMNGNPGNHLASRQDMEASSPRYQLGEREPSSNLVNTSGEGSLDGTAEREVKKQGNELASCEIKLGVQPERDARKQAVCHMQDLRADSRVIAPEASVVDHDQNPSIFEECRIVDNLLCSRQVHPCALSQRKVANCIAVGGGIESFSFC